MVRKHERMKSIFVIALTVALLFTVVVSPIPAVDTVAAAQATASVRMAANVNAKLYDAQLLKQEQGQLAALTLEINNQSSNSLKLLDYWAKIARKSGGSYSTRLIEADKSIESVPAKSIVYLTYYAVVDNNVKLSDLKIDLIEWNFSSTNYERTLGSLSVSGNGEVLPYKSKEMLFGNNKLNGAITQYTLYKDTKYGYVSIDLELENLSIRTLDLSQLSFLAQSGQNVYNIESSKTALTLKPKETKQITLSLTLPVAEIGKKLTIAIAAPEGTGKVQLPLGIYAMPELKATVAVKQGSPKNFYLGGQTIKVTSGDSSVSISANQETLTTQFIMENIGQTKTELPAVEFFLKTKDGYLYPLKYDNEGSIVLLPKIEQIIKLSGQIPNKDTLKTSELVMFFKSDDQSSHFLGNFSLNLSSETVEEGSPSTVYNDLSITQESIHRTPNDLTDLIVAEFSVLNMSDHAKAKPEFNGYFVIDGVKINPDKTTISVLDNLAIIGPGQQLNMLVYTEVPYTQNINKIEFVMNEVDANKNEKYVHSFNVNSLSSAEKLDTDQALKVTNLGKSSEIRFIKSGIFKGTSSDIFYAELEYMNKERRANVPAELAGYIQNRNGSIIDLAFSEYEERVLPNGKVVVSAWAKIPKNFEKETISFYFGESFELASSNSAVIKPVYVNHAVQEIVVKDTLTDLNFMNYNLSMRYFVVTLSAQDGFNVDGINLSFEYDLVSDETDREYADEHKILVEFVDRGTQKMTLSKEFILGSDNSKDEVLVEGTKLQKQIHLADSQAHNKTDYSGFTINIYDVYKGNKLLLASKDMQWGIINN